jgi:hypothetical protein
MSRAEPEQNLHASSGRITLVAPALVGVAFVLPVVIFFVVFQRIQPE